jgi:uncharacterized membrane protein YfcA
VLELIAILVVTGAVVGFTAALLGVGGGFIMVPVMYWAISGTGVSDDVAVLTAFGTSLLVIVPTVLSSTWRHHKNGAVVWPVAITLGVCGALLAVAGSTIAAYTPGSVLKTGFGVFVLIIAARMAIGVGGEKGTTELPEAPSRPRLVALGCVMGLIAGMTGLGGGALMVPALVLLFRFPMLRAVATSSAAIIFTAPGGILGYILNGIGVDGRLPYSLGYVNLAVALAVVVLSVPMAQLGARAAHAMDARRLRILFAVLMVYVGLRMIGLWALLGL